MDIQGASGGHVTAIEQTRIQTVWDQVGIVCIILSLLSKHNTPI